MKLWDFVFWDFEGFRDKRFKGTIPLHCSQMDTSTCTKCKKEKPIEEFGFKDETEVYKNCITCREKRRHNKQKTKHNDENNNLSLPETDEEFNRLYKSINDYIGKDELFKEYSTVNYIKHGALIIKISRAPAECIELMKKEKEAEENNKSNIDKKELEKENKLLINFITHNEYPTYEFVMNEILLKLTDQRDKVEQVSAYDKPNHQCMKTIYENITNKTICQEQGDRIDKLIGFTGMNHNFYTYCNVIGYMMKNSKYNKKFTNDELRSIYCNLTCLVKQYWNGVGEWKY